MENQLAKNKQSPRKRAVNLLVHIILAVLAVAWLLPIVWIVLTSFRAEPGAYTKTFLPQGYTLNNYIRLLTADHFHIQLRHQYFLRAVGSVLAQPYEVQIP